MTVGQARGNAATGPAGHAPRGAGRPPVSSRSAIEDAAGELFLENSYARTSIDQIASRAGVSRTSFFNYFAAKSDLLWGDVDLLVEAVGDHLTALPAEVLPMEGVRRALVAAASVIGSDRIPLAATQAQVMGAGDELLASGFVRFARLASLIHDHLEHRPDARTNEVGAPATGAAGTGAAGTGAAGTGAAGTAAAGTAAARAAAYAVVGAVAAAATEWAAAGTARGALPDRIDAAISPVCDGFARIFPPS